MPEVPQTPVTQETAQPEVDKLDAAEFAQYLDPVILKDFLSGFDQEEMEKARIVLHDILKLRFEEVKGNFQRDYKSPDDQALLETEVRRALNASIMRAKEAINAP